MDILCSSKAWKWQVVYLYFLCSWGWVSGQLHYSIAEESEPGSLVGNVAQDLGLHIADIYRRRLYLGSEGSKRHFAVNQKTGVLTVNERIDREILCGSISTCILPVEISAENPFEVISLEIEILDINDNSPTFSNANHTISITELHANPGVRFPLEMAKDPDVGINGIKQYKINKTPYFSLSVKNRKDGTLIPELTLERALDREEKKEHRLILTAVDGGEPARSGSCKITVIVLDFNDNAPVFFKPIYKITLLENTKLNTICITLNATDLDEGPNSEIEYYFDNHNLDSALEIFSLNSQTGEVSIKGIVDYEETKFHELSIRAKDKGILELEGHCLVQIEIEDVNDNSPEIILTSVSTYLPENSPLETPVAFFTVKDKDSGKNGEVKLEVSHNLPFIIKPFNSQYSLVTDGVLDREKISQFTIQLVATDLGSPAMQTQAVVKLNVSDINDNPPVFLQEYYEAFIKENNEPGHLLCVLSAFDLDEGVNAELTYSLVESKIDGSSVSSFVYINPQSGNIYAQRAIDYEQNPFLQITVRVEDAGFPRLFSDITVSVFVLDANDNYPTVLYPQYSREPINEIMSENVPKSASVGYLVTKVSAVDLDSGHNAWLHFSLDEKTDVALFKISESTGEIRTFGTFYEQDKTEQQLVILVSDHGEPSLTTTVTIIINIVDNEIQESLKSRDFLMNSSPKQDLTLYLIISLVAISLVSLVTFIILLVKCLKKEDYNNSKSCCFLSRTSSKQYVDQYQPTLYLNTDGTLKYMEVRMVPPESQAQCYQACFPQTAGKYDLNISKPLDFPPLKTIINENETSSETSCLNDPNQENQHSLHPVLKIVLKH
ncbi:hypothetical protein GDO86_005271 [Hymenochirus boettgeri]|uniref:Cadherin domain-containing protein n=1 Tax=Hymenochirus boettgeri TaxID=247094 RepID=A0A8T2J3Z0_9PIPI|nr:hypothetical protein GDO86_005271 [Hymenochirus boettgeri]